VTCHRNKLSTAGSASPQVASGAAEVDLLMLVDVLRARAGLEQVREALDRDGLTFAWTKGQDRPHPLLSTEANLRTEIAAGFDRLKLSASKRGDDYGIEIGRNGRLKKW